VRHRSGPRSPCRTCSCNPGSRRRRAQGCRARSAPAHPSRRREPAGARPSARRPRRIAEGLLDHLVCSRQHRRRDRQAERLRGLEVEHQVELRRLLDWLCILFTPSALSTLEFRPGLVDDGRHDHPDPHRPPPWCPDPALPRAREPRVAAPTGRPPAHRAASTAANRRPLFWVLLSRLWAGWTDGVSRLRQAFAGLRSDYGSVQKTGLNRSAQAALV
jgi:hypothetical protein